MTKSYPAEPNLPPEDRTSSGENLCHKCDGSGRLESGEPCPECGGTGKIREGIGGA